MTIQDTNDSTISRPWNVTEPAWLQCPTLSGMYFWKSLLRHEYVMRRDVSFYMGRHKPSELVSLIIITIMGHKKIGFQSSLHPKIEVSIISNMNSKCLFPDYIL